MTDDPTRGAQARADAVSQALERLVPGALVELAAVDSASRGVLIDQWRAEAARALDLSRHVREGEPITDDDLIAYARTTAVQACSRYGVKTWSLIFCALHYPSGLPTFLDLMLCPDCAVEYAEPDYPDDIRTAWDPDLTPYLPPARAVADLTPRGDLL